MPEETLSNETATAVVNASETPADKFETPPPAAMPERRETDPRARLCELALELARTQNRRLLIEYLRLRRTAR